MGLLQLQFFKKSSIQDISFYPWLYIVFVTHLVVLISTCVSALQKSLACIDWHLSRETLFRTFQQQFFSSNPPEKMPHFVLKCYLLFILTGISHQGDDFSTPSAAWLEYQRERFGVNNPLIAMSPTKAPPNPNVDVVTPKVETTSRKHSSNAPENVSEESGEEETTEQPSEDSDGIELPSMQGFIKFLKTMQKTWVNKTALTFGKKIKLLQNLRDNLMQLIGA